ncbi:MAG: ABC-type antimicrobial peptide transport system, permease component [Firmicutes bacterium]|nr:ABC-type antimicrobial peptide transport system, permease component [Bacillota bacterium]
MNIFETVIVSFSSIWANKMRSFLTMLGIIIGISSVMIITTLGLGVQGDIKSEFSRYGLNRADISMKWDPKNPPVYRDYITYDDVETIAGMQGQVEAISPRISRYVTVKGNNKNYSILLNGVTPDFLKIEKVELLKGRFVSDQDEKAKRNVLVLDEKTAREIFGTVDCLGETMTVSSGFRSLELMIIGITKVFDSTMAKMFDETNDKKGYTPVSIMRTITYNPNLERISVAIDQSFHVKTIGDMLIGFLERKHKAPDKYRLFDYNSNMDEVTNVFGIVTKIVSGIAAISLVVGGIGIMNIMLVSVTERTREIGIRKALGAKRKSILYQFLCESVILSLIGGILGLLLGSTVGFTVVRLLKLPFVISIGATAVSVVVTIGIGVVFGVYPASQASKLDPVEALRYE